MTDPIDTDGALPLGGADAFRDWDAAYVLGALSPAERRRFEAHLAGCPRCTRAVAELVALPGLLASLPASQAPGADRDPDSAASPPVRRPTTMRRALLGRVRRQRRLRSLGNGLVGALVATVLVLGIVFGPGVLNPPRTPNVSSALVAVQPSPLSADVQLTSVRWGTKIDMACTYGSSGSSGGWGTSARSYGLFATDVNGQVVRIASWSAAPGQVVHAGGSTDLPLAEIKELDVRALDTDTVLLTLHIR